MKERRTSDVVLLVLGAFVLAFEVCMIVIFCIKGSVPDTLIQYTLGAGGVEALALAGIRVSKEISKTKTQDESKELKGETQEETQEHHEGA